MGDPFRDRVKDGKKTSNSWRPNPKEYITGELIGIRTTHYKGKPVRVADLLNDETKEEISVWLTTVLEREFTDQKIHEGERIGIKYLGKVKDYHDFVVMVDRPPEEAKEDVGEDGSEPSFD